MEKEEKGIKKSDLIWLWSFRIYLVICLIIGILATVSGQRIAGINLFIICDFLLVCSFNLDDEAED